MCGAYLTLFLALAGCGYSHNRASPHTAAPLEPAPKPRWPATWTGELPSSVAKVRDVKLRPQALSGADSDPQIIITRELVSLPLGSGLITYSQDVFPNGTPITQPESKFDFFAWRERPAAMDALRTSPEGKAEAASLWALTASAPFHMEFRLWRPTDRQPKGLVLYQWGLSGYRYEKELITALTDRGWAVLSHNGLSWKRPGALTVSPEVPGSGPPKPAESITVSGRVPDDRHPDAEARSTYIQAAAALAATDFDDAVGLYALANETALEFVRTQDPSIPTSPLAIVGCSFGAIMSPTVVTRLDANGLSPSAVVLIGGGTNFLEVAGSDWMDYYYSRVRGRSTTELHLAVADRRAVSREYLERSTLDPYHTVASLRDKHVLMLHASMDNIVPASRGDDLWERAGRPERWVGNFGHLFMFATLSWRSDDIADWLDKACAQPTVPE